MLSRKEKKNVRAKMQRKYEEWITRGTGTAAQYLGMTDREFEDWLVHGKIPERLMK